MSEKKRTIAIFDVGKTNKKAFLLDENYQIVWGKSAHLAETADEDGDPCEDIAALADWVKNTWAELNGLPDFAICALNFSTYGATFAHLDKNGAPLAPLYNYLKPYPADLQAQFYAQYGGEADFSRQTASPVLGSLNSGMVLYRLKYAKPDVFSAIHCSLHLPQYLSFLFTKRYFSDITSIGCHTSLWNFDAKNYHVWVDTEGVSEKLAPIGTTQVADNQNDLKVGIGLHDSSAALIPYLLYAKEPFVLLSTGTWNIALNPFNDAPLTQDELQKDCLCYLTYEGKPVKASRLFAGYEHEQATKQLAEKWNVAPDYYKSVVYDPSVFGESAACFERDYHHFMRELVEKQVRALALVLTADVKNLYVDGGFSQNAIFMKMLVEALPKHRIFAAEVAQASAIGAALALHHDWNARPLPEHLIQLKPFF